MPITLPSTRPGMARMRCGRGLSVTKARSAGMVGRSVTTTAADCRVHSTLEFVEECLILSNSVGQEQIESKWQRLSSLNQSARVFIIHKLRHHSRLLGWSGGDGPHK